MTVVIVGVAADGENVQPIPPVHPDGRFEYIPIPEPREAQTVEETTFGTWELRHSPGTAADYLDHIDPGSNPDRRQRGSDLAGWPIHHDPNFDALSYGESDGRPAYLKQLRNLDAGDVVAFYAGLRSEDGQYTNRHIIGYFTVARLIDLGDLDPEAFNGCTTFADLSKEDQNRFIEEHRENAHSKRYLRTGEINQGLVIVDGEPPGGLLESAFQISEYRNGGHRLTDELEERFNPVTSSGQSNAYLGGFKMAHTLDIGPDRFRQIVTN